MPLSVTTLAVACLVLLAAGYLAFFLLERSPKMAPVIKDVWPVLHVETLIVGTVALCFWLGGWVLAMALTLHALRVGFEAASVTARRGLALPPLAVGAALAGLGWLASLLPAPGLRLAGLGALGITLINRLALRRRADSPLAAALDLVALPGIPLVVFTGIGLQGGYGAWLLAAFILVETFDSYALLGGKLFGRTRAFPVLSPNKTVEGLVIGAAMLMLTAGLLGAWAGAPLWSGAAVALVAGGFTLAGDLTASRLKRLSGVKDFPQLLPHQGGLFDTTDAWIATGAGLVCLAVIFNLG